MLERLDAVDWSALRDAFGSADGVDELIRALGDPDAGVRDRAGTELYERVFHQGTRYAATASVLPFLVELATGRGTPDRPGRLRELAYLAVGLGLDDPDGFSVEELRRLPPAATDRMPEGEVVERVTQRRRRRDAIATYDAARALLPALIPLLDDADPAVRAETAHLLGWFPEDAASLLPAVRAAARAEPDPAVRATLLISLGMLGRAHLSGDDLA